MAATIDGSCGRSGAQTRPVRRWTTGREWTAWAGLFAFAALSGCGAGSATTGGTSSASQPNPPTFFTSSAQNGASVLRIESGVSGATVHYTVDGSTPTASSQVYEAPVLIASNETVKAINVANGASSIATSFSFTPNIASGTLAWSDEFENTSGEAVGPGSTIWTYDTGNGGFGNSELETYCAWGSNSTPCSTASPNAYVGTDGYLHIVARQPSSGVYTSARLKTQGLFSFQYGRLEVRALVPEGQGLWPAVWLLGNNIATVNWPACGEMDVLERINAATDPDWNEGSIHGTGFTGSTGVGTEYSFPSGQTAGGWHTYGMIWAKGKVSYYIDDPTQPYATYTPSSLSGLSGAVWPFDSGQASFIILNLAVGGSWPGAPDATTVFPAEMLVDYVRIYTN